MKVILKLPEKKMTHKLQAAFLAAAFSLFAAPSLIAQSAQNQPAPSQPDQQWIATQSTLTYHMSHPMHEVDGTSHAARGKGVCHAGSCEFLIAVPVKTFNSGDTNRDLHMIEAIRGAEFPMIVVHARFPESQIDAQWIHADLDVQFAGRTAHYSNVPFQRTQQGTDVRITGSIPLTCSDFKITRPSFLTVPIKNEIPVKIDMTWHKE